MRGRKRKHAAIHKLDGTYRPREHDQGADNLAAVGECLPTRELGVEGTAWFHAVIAAYPGGTLGESDSEALTRCCEWVDRSHALAKLERESGEPMIRDAEKCDKMFLAFATRFGLTPTERGKVKIPVASGDDKKEKKFFGVTG